MVVSATALLVTQTIAPGAVNMRVLSGEARFGRQPGRSTLRELSNVRKKWVCMCVCVLMGVLLV